MNHMRASGISKVVPRLDPKDCVKESNFRGGHLNGGLTSSYLTRYTGLEIILVRGRQKFTKLRQKWQATAVTN